MVLRRSWVVAILASCTIHTGFVAAAMVMVGAGRTPADPALHVELVEPPPDAPTAAPPPDPPRPRPERMPPPKRPAPAPLTLPKPIETPLPKMEEAHAPDIPPPAVREPEPPPAPPEPKRVEPAPEPAVPRTLAGATQGAPAPAVATGPPATGGDVAPGGVTWPAGGSTSSSDRAGSGTGATGGAGMTARGTGDVTSTAYPRGGYQVRPSYPASARRLGIQGTSLLRVFVGADGKVSDVVVQESAGHADLDEAATAAVRRWRFEPARRGTEAVAMWVLLPVEFHLK
jgi:periplasmic protein TonB